MKCQGIIDGKACDTDIDPSGKFCEHCGTSVDQSVQKITCKCGAIVRKDHKFCFSCGTSIIQLCVDQTHPSLCTACGFNLLPALAFCPRCGTRKPEPTPVIAHENLQTNSESENKNGDKWADISTVKGPEVYPQLFGQYADKSFSRPDRAVAAPSIGDVVTASEDMPCNPGREKTREGSPPQDVYLAVTNLTLQPILRMPVQESTTQRSAASDPLPAVARSQAENQDQEMAEVPDATTAGSENLGSSVAVVLGTPELGIQAAGSEKATSSVGGSESTVGLSAENTAAPGPSVGSAATDPMQTDDQEEEDDDTQVSEDENGNEGKKVEDPADKKTGKKSKKKNKKKKKKMGADHGLSTPSQPTDNKSITSSQSADQKGMNYAGALKAGAPFNTRNNADNQAKKNSLIGNSDHVTVVFHVIISGTFDVNINTDSVCIRCEPSALGGFNMDVDKHVMKHVKETDIGFMFEGKINMPKTIRNYGFQYKYVVKKARKDKKVEWEFVLKRHKVTYLKTSQAEVNRRFYIPATHRSYTGEWHWYDGVAYPQEVRESGFKSFTKNVGKKIGLGIQTLEDRVREEAVISAKEFLPTVEMVQRSLSRTQSADTDVSKAKTGGTRYTGEDLLKQVTNVMDSMKHQLLDKKLESEDSQLANQCLREALLLPLCEIIEAQLSPGGKRTATLALFVWILKQRCLVFLTQSVINMLCRAMLIIPDPENRSCPDMSDLSNSFPFMMKDRTLTQAVADLIEKSDVEKEYKADPSWWCCLPLLHFLEESSRPFLQLGPSTSFDDKAWWGHAKCTRRKEAFKQNSKQMKNMSDFIELLRPAFAADAMLSRTVVASLDFEPLLTLLLKAPVPVEVTAATLIHHIKLRGSYDYFNQTQLDMLHGIFNKMINLLPERDVSVGHAVQLNQISCLCKLVQELLANVNRMSTLFSDDHVLELVQLAFSSLDIWSQLEAVVCTESNSTPAQQWRGNAEAIVKNICGAFSRHYPLYLPLNYEKPNLPRHLKIWGHLFLKTESLSEKGLKECLEDQIAKDFESEVNKLPATDKLEVFLQQADQVVPAFVVILNRLAFESLEEVLKTGSTNMRENDIRLISLLSRLLEQKYSEVTGQEKDIFYFTIIWDPMVNYLQIFKKEASMKNLSVAAKGIVQSSLVSLDSVYGFLCDGQIALGQLHFILDHHERYSTVMAAFGLDKDRLHKVLGLRGHELLAYTFVASALKKLLEHCKAMLKTDDIDDICTAVLKQQEQEDKCPLNSVVEVVKPNTFPSLNQYKPKCNPWKIPDKVLQILPDFEKKISCIIFDRMLHEAARHLQPSDATFWRAFLGLWDDVNQEWQALLDQIVEGSLTLRAAEKAVFDVFKVGEGKYNFTDMDKEMCKMARTGEAGIVQWVDERIHQFKCFLDIRNYVTVAVALVKVAETYNITGNFEDVYKICKMSKSKDLPFKNLDVSMLKLCDQLKGITDGDVKCLKGLANHHCKDFFQWLRKNMKGGLKELNVFVDLAFISAGEEPMSIHRVNIFHAAATGYAPLIFTENVKGCKQLLAQCKLVFANIKADPKLSQKLEDTVRFLDWFKDVHKSHGSVEKTSLSQVSNINSRGVFKLSRAERAEITLNEVIKLTVSSEEAGKPARDYSYTELLDLQSRLMLVAGQAEKGNVNVDHFITLMENMVRLGKTFVQLCHDGCVLFLDWNVTFLCDASKPVCCVSQFAKQGLLKGHHSPAQTPAGKAENVEDFIAGLASFLERCHSEWLEYVHQKRKEYPELNVYTVEQLLFLQQQLVKVDTADVSIRVYPMLSLVKENCTPQDLIQALEAAMDCVDGRQEQQAAAAGSRTSVSQAAAVAIAKDPSSQDMEAKETLFVEEIMSCGYSQALALKALAAVDCNNVADGIAWCMTHDEEEAETEAVDDSEVDMADSLPQQHQQQQDQRQTFGQRLKGWVTRTETITQSAIGWLQNLESDRGNSLRWMVDNLTSVWRKFLDTVSSSGTDFLSLEHLGIVLSCLAKQDARHFLRKLPPDLKTGIPNLILCRKREVLNVVTYLYMFAEGDNNPLPQPDEVLLCTQHTTFEQVHMLLRRAMFGCQRKVYTLAFADSLDYDVGERVEKMVNEYVNETGNKDYQLVVVCTKENEFRARIVAALEKYQRPDQSLVKSDDVRKFLRARFFLQRGGHLSASSLDPENLSVRVVQSLRSGVGKTLYKESLRPQLEKLLPKKREPLSITIPLHSREADVEHIAKCLLEHTLPPASVLPRIIHLDISYQVLEGVDHLLYNLLVLGCITDHHGQVWLRSPMDLYLVEIMPLYDHRDNQRDRMLVHQILDVLPSVNCWSPRDSLSIMGNTRAVEGYHQYDQLFHDEKFNSDLYQRPFRYLYELEHGQQQPNAQGDVTAQKAQCLATILRYCGVQDPSWSELTHFVCFLNKQLQDFETSLFCGLAASQDLPGFSLFVLRFLIQMSRDFATRSLKITEESLAALNRDDDNNADIQQYEMRRTWESSPHPYIFFNPDGHSMTFLGFFIDPGTGNLVDQQTGLVLEQAIMNIQLFQALHVNRVPLTENFDALPRADRLLRLYRVLGLYDEEIFDDNHDIIDPDDTYELTTDNVKKILAIYMRFRCNIPVIVMGETGCGKTRLVKFLCALQSPRNPDMNTMVLVKVHGGTTGEDIIKKVRNAELIARQNAAAVGHRPVYTVLFFDEANTTEAVGVIKEVMCDGTLNGQQIHLTESLKMVAACNPYRKHSEELIERLENAGLGYHVDADKTIDKLGRVPMRRLVYRVQPLPQSMLPLVWDFGQLNTRVEELYIRQMVKRYVRNGQLRVENYAGEEVICRCLMASQEYMRQLTDECSFVSLRDVDRALTVTSWFLNQGRSSSLFKELDEKLSLDEEEEEETREEDEEEEELEGNDYDPLSDMTKALVLALGVCYRACLRNKADYDQHVAPYIQPPFSLPGGADQFDTIIDSCQDVFLDNVYLEDNIARNQALKENVFMMVVCVELRIPLFLVGKPGSSKSLAKTIVADAMQGKSARRELFKAFKQVQMVSFQCSPLATADGILGTFRQCAQFQEGKNLDTSVSVVVLDEVGLAEDSPKMPLKTLHPLLEDGCPDDEEAKPSKKVAFIGISNWALDPAKMNRGILVQRDVPDIEELEETAKGICNTQNEQAKHHMTILIPALAKAYLTIFEMAKTKREFFGLRDFYSLVKMVYTFAAKSNQTPSGSQLVAAIRRNFGGLDTVDPVEPFRQLLPNILGNERVQNTDKDCSPAELIKAALRGVDTEGESRYLLMLTENYGGLSILSEHLLAGRKTVPIFGSSFPRDQEYTQICRNINRIKVCMETGQTVILLNLENLYESLYDALNQYYAMLGGERYVDLGLGTHRVKCRVHRNFRLIVVAEKQVVYDKFPIPLINRLEKHFLTLNNIMTEDQIQMALKLEEWAKTFLVTQQPVFGRQGKKQEDVGEVFMGWHPDAAPAIVLKVWDTLGVDQNPTIKEQVLEQCQKVLLWCATPDAVIRLKEEVWSKVYGRDQTHRDLAQYLQWSLTQHLQAHTTLMAQVTTHSKLLTEEERQALLQLLPVSSITLLSLLAFDTEQQFCQQLREFFKPSPSPMADEHKLLIVQCDSRDSNQNLVKGAQYCMQDQKPENSSQHHVVFVVQLSRVAGACFTGFLGGNWHCLHIDELRSSELAVPDVTVLQKCTPAELLFASLGEDEQQMELEPSPLERDDDSETQKNLDSEQMEVGVEEVQLQFDLNTAEGMEAEEAATNPRTSRRPELPDAARPEDPDLMDVVTAGADNTSSAILTGEPNQWLEPNSGFPLAYVRQLLTSIVQSAVSLVRDTEDETARATRRVSLLLRLLEENDEFFKGLHKLVSSILKEREQQAYEPQQWLARDAAKPDAVKQAGTFRRAWMQHIEKKIVPVLAGVVAYLDTNYNLDLVARPTLCGQGHDLQPQWIQQVWLDTLNRVCRMAYSNMRSIIKKEELEEFTVHHTGAGAAPFSAALPFSWLVFELVHNAVIEAKHASGSVVDTVGSVVEESPLGACLKKGVDGSQERLQDLFKLYISDLIHFSFPLGNRTPEHQLLRQCVQKGLRQLRVDLMQLDLGRGVVSLHLLLDQLRPRLQLILDIAAIRPCAVDILRQSPALANPDEMVEDVALLYIIVEELKPQPKEFLDEAGCRQWLTRCSVVTPVVLRVLADSETELQLLDSNNQANAAGAEAEEESEIQTISLPYGDVCKRQLAAIRYMWTRITTMKLFFDFVGPLRQGPDKLRKALGLVKYQLLWSLLDDDADMKSVKTLKMLDKFLKHANGFVIRELLGRIGKCTFCEKKFEAAPIELPCKHALCNSCYRDSRHGDGRNGQCPECQTALPPDFDPAKFNHQNKEAVELLGQYQRQVSGFLMAVVSQLSFAGLRPPDPEAVRHIFGYITHRSKGKTLLQTKHMTVHDDLIDPTPVLRSFLLRLLLKHSETEVHGYLEEFIENTQLLAAQEQQISSAAGTPTLLEFCLLIIHCREDLHQEEEAARSSRDNTAPAAAVNSDHLQGLFHHLQHLRLSFQRGGKTGTLTSVYNLGLLRYVLDTCSGILHELFVACEEETAVSRELEDFLEELKQLCLRLGWAKKFLVKQLCRENGLQSYMALAKLARQARCRHLLDWIVFQEPAARHKVEEVVDRYVVCGPHYKTIRDAVAQLQLTGDNKEMVQILQAIPSADAEKETLLLLALHREIAMSALHHIPEEARTAMLNTIKTFVQECDWIRDKALAAAVCEHLLGDRLRVSADFGLADQSMLCVLTHLRLALPAYTPVSHLLGPLLALLYQPGTMMNSFLPTMPQDNVEDILQGIEPSTYGPATLWRCPNGHRYMVGDCGRPIQVNNARCNDCGAKIGGTAYNAPEANNVQLDREKADTTQRGHILGQAGQRGLESVPERQLSAVECAFLRFLTHACLYLACTDHRQRDSVERMVQPRVPADQLCPFFWQHLAKDVQVIQKVLGRSADDVYVLLHHLCHSLLAALQTGGHAATLQTKAERSTWEQLFARAFISPLVLAVDDVVKQGNGAIITDKRRADNSVLLATVYEMDGGAPAALPRVLDIADLINNPAIWRYRPRISVGHFFRYFYLHVENLPDMRDKFRVIRLVKKELHILHALHYVPAILVGQRRLMMQLHRRLDRAEAATVTVKDVLVRKECEGLADLLRNFSNAWEIVKEHLITYNCMTTSHGLVSLPEQFHNSRVTSSSPLAVLLPSAQGPGLCSYILLQYLLSQHNVFLQHYCPLVQQSYRSLPEVAVRAVTEHHLVGCHPDRELLPLVLSHSNYSLMVGQAATLEYDFAAFEQQLCDIMLQCKARVQVEIETMVYRADTTISRLFRILRSKIPQVCLSPAERRQIVEELGRDNLPEVCQSIDNLNTALSFLKALGGSPREYLQGFMAGTLKMKHTIFSQKAQQLCQFKHVQSLWIVLCFHRASIMAAHKSEAFESVDEALKVDLSTTQQQEVEGMCQTMSVERLELLLLLLFESIMLQLSEPRDQDDDTQPENYRLREILEENVNGLAFYTETRTVMLTKAHLKDLPQSLLGQHACATWLSCCRYLAVKLQQQ